METFECGYTSDGWMWIYMHVCVYVCAYLMLTFTDGSYFKCKKYLTNGKHSIKNIDCKDVYI